MATVSVLVCRLEHTFPDGSPCPVVSSNPAVDENFTSSGTSQQTTGSVPTQTNHRQGFVWEVAAAGGAIWVAFGSNPTAAAGASFLIPQGSVRHFGAKSGDKAAIIDA